VTAPLIGVDALAAEIAADAVRVADVRWYLAAPERGQEEYAAGHIPGAVFVDLAADLSSDDGPGRHPLPPRDVFAGTMGRLGFGDDDLIVAYDDASGSVAARLWWMLRDIGHDRVAVLDGGIQAWTASGRSLERSLPEIPPATMAVRAPLTRTIDRETLAGRLDELVVIDARAPERYRGETEPIDPEAGHIPTARNVPHADNVATDLRFLPARMLAARYGHAGATFDSEVVVYCGSGVTACHDALAMTVAGLPEPMLYPGSWSDWSTAGMPVETGDSPLEID